MEKLRKDDILAKLPETMEKQLFMYDQTVHNFVHCLMRGDDVYSVIDQMFVYYTKVIRHHDNLFKEFYELGLTPQEAKKLIIEQFLIKENERNKSSRDEQQSQPSNP
jgi:hypothetical protein